MRIRIANAPVSWGIMEVKGWSAPLPHTEFLDELRAAGYDGTELGPYGYMPIDFSQLAEDLSSRSLSLISAFVPLPLKAPKIEFEPLRTAARVLRELGARHVVVADALWPEREKVAGRVADCGIRLTSCEWSQAVSHLREACRVAAAFGLRCVFHQHVGTYIETPNEVEELLGLADIGLCLDTGHYVYGGGDPVEAVMRFGKRVEYLHLKDVNRVRLDKVRREKLGFLGGVRAGVFCTLGAGCVRFPELLTELEKIDYDGWAVVEQDVDARGPCGSSPLECARKSREYLRESLGI